MKKDTYLEKSVKAFLKDEYNLADVGIKISITSADGKNGELKRLSHDATNESQFDLKEERKC